MDRGKLGKWTEGWKYRQERGQRNRRWLQLGATKHTHCRLPESQNFGVKRDLRVF